LRCEIIIEASGGQSGRRTNASHCLGETSRGRIHAMVLYADTVPWTTRRLNRERCDSRDRAGRRRSCRSGSTRKAASARSGCRTGHRSSHHNSIRVDTLPMAGLQVRRTLELHDHVVRVRESVRNLSACDRPVGWTQHVTLAPPCLQPGETEHGEWNLECRLFPKRGAR
jgi:hypothetical protein